MTIARSSHDVVPQQTVSCGKVKTGSVTSPASYAVQSYLRDRKRSKSLTSREAPTIALFFFNTSSNLVRCSSVKTPRISSFFA